MSLSLLRGLARRFGRTGPVLRESDPGAGPIIDTERLDADFAAGDSSYNACLAGSDGVLYFALSTHCPDQDARLYCLDPAGNRPQSIADIGDIAYGSGNGPGDNGLRHGKVHVPLFEWSGAIYTATLQAVPPGRRKYSGGCFLRIDMGTRDVEVVGRAPEGEGVITMAIDRERGRLYGMTYPHGVLLSCDLAAGTTSRIGRFFGKGEQGLFRKPGASPICRSLALDPRDGTVYWSDSLGRIRAYDVASGASYWLPGRPLERDGFRRSYIWRQVLWHPGEQVFYGLQYYHGGLFRFDPEQSSVDFIDHLSAAQYRSGNPAYEPPATLAFCLEPGNETLYCLTTGPGMVTHSNRRVRSTVHLVSWHLPSGRYRDLGTLRLGDGRYPVLCQSMAISGETVYAICWIELPSRRYDSNWDAIRAARAKGRPVESEGFLETAHLVRFPMPRGPERFTRVHG